MNPIKSLLVAIRRYLGLEELLVHSRDLRRRSEELRTLARSQQALLRDLHASQVFHDRILGSSWFTRQCLSPGGWAVDYGFLKTLYVVLSSMQPKNILEFGLGQSSKLVHQYAAHFGANALTCENSDDWISFFFKSENPDVSPNPLPPLSDLPLLVDSSLGYPVKIRRLPLEQIKIRDVLTTTYQDVETVFAGQTFDFILVDGPRGQPRFSRPQIISLAERNLADRFCIMVDDTQRRGERETIAEVESVLNRRNIPFAKATHRSSKSHTLLFSPSLGFLGST